MRTPDAGRRPRGERVGAAFTVAITVLVAVAIGLGAVRNLLSGEPVLAAVGVGMLLLVAVGLYLVAAEVRLGQASARLARRLEREGGLPSDPPGVERRASGRLHKADADAVFALRQADVQAAPEDWRAWFRLASAYGDAGDTARGRKAVRRAVALERAEQASGTTRPDT